MWCPFCAVLFLTRDCYAEHLDGCDDSAGDHVSECLVMGDVVVLADRRPRASNRGCRLAMLEVVEQFALERSGG